MGKRKKKRKRKRRKTSGHIFSYNGELRIRKKRMAEKLNYIGMSNLTIYFLRRRRKKKEKKKKKEKLEREWRFPLKKHFGHLHHKR